MKWLIAPLALGLLLVAMVVPPFALGVPVVSRSPSSPIITVPLAAPVTAAPKAAVTAAPTVAPAHAAASVAAAAAAPAKLTGKVVSVSGVSLVVKPNAAAAAPLTVTTSADTIVTINRKAVLLSYLQAGMSVVVTPGTGTAVTVAATAPIPKTVVGAIVSISSSNVVIQPAVATAAQVTVAIDSSTVITLGGKASTLAGIYPGMKVTAHPWFSGEASLLAVTAPMPKTVVGTIIAVGTAIIVVQPAATTAAQVTFTADANTVVTLNGAASALAKLIQPMKVTVQPWYDGSALRITATAPPVNCSRCHPDGRTGPLPPGHFLVY